jgi:hypothetical protein
MENILVRLESCQQHPQKRNSEEHAYEDDQSMADGGCEEITDFARLFFRAATLIGLLNQVGG